MPSSVIFDQSRALGLELLILEPETMTPHLLPSKDQSKMGDFIYIEQWRLTNVLDPFTISFDQFSKLNFADASRLQDAVYEKFSEKLQSYWRRGVRQVVVCDEDIVYETDSIIDIPNEKALSYGKEKNKAVYVFTAPDLVEESAWCPTMPPYDEYPTIPLFLGEETVDENKIDDPTLFANVVTDFDTGTSVARIFAWEVLTQGLKRYVPPIRSTDHLGVKYDYFNRSAKILVRTVSQIVHSTASEIRVVPQWQGSALLQANPNRFGFVGRSIIGDLRVKLELDPVEKKTRFHEPTSSIS
jgi:hypothetical protein